MEAQLEMKKLFAVTLILAMLLTLSACGGQDSSIEAENGTAPEYEITMASFDSSGTVGNLCGERFEELVEERSGGRIQINFYQDAVLGSETENMQQIKTGEIPLENSVTTLVARW